MEPLTSPGRRSTGFSGPTLIKLIGWGWTVLAAIGLAGCFFNLIIHLLGGFPDPPRFERLQHRGAFHDYMAWWREYSLQFLIIGFILNSSTLLASVALLRRRPWARAVLQFLIGVHLAMLVLITVLQLRIVGSFMKDTGGPEIGPGFVKPAFTVLFVAMTLGTSAGFCIMYGLCIAGLRSAKVRTELGGPRGGSASSLKRDS